MWFSDDLGGEILYGVIKEGLVIFLIFKILNVDNVLNIRLIWWVNFDIDNYNEEFLKDFDVFFDLIK